MQLTSSWYICSMSTELCELATSSLESFALSYCFGLSQPAYAAVNAMKVTCLSTEVNPDQVQQSQNQITLILAGCSINMTSDHTPDISIVYSVTCTMPCDDKQGVLVSDHTCQLNGQGTTYGYPMILAAVASHRQDRAVGLASCQTLVWQSLANFGKFGNLASLVTLLV